ncbi:Protein Y53F4B.12, partial [Aphelenchoides avenae]
GSLCLSTTFFFILPHAFATAESRSVPLLPLAFAVALQVLAAYQLSTIAKQIPRNCLLYNFAYATHSECLAFAVAWSQLFDGLCFIAVLAHCLSDHVNMLFNNVVVNYLRFYAPGMADGTSWQVDAFAVSAVVICGVLSCCSLRVLSTISIIFLISALFTTTSTTVVALLHNAAHLNVEYVGLPASYDEAIRVSSWFLIAFLCLECFSFVPEETEQAQESFHPSSLYSRRFHSE